jgi:hypothetical protein
MVEWVSHTQIPKGPGSNDLDTVRGVAVSIKKRKPIEKYGVIDPNKFLNIMGWMVIYTKTL